MNHINGLSSASSKRETSYSAPGMSSQIEDKVSKCSKCSQFQRAQPKELMGIQELPNRPWAKIGSDLFELNGAHYLLSVDYYSKWIEIAKLSNICHLKSQFARYRIPDEVISDNGPQYSSFCTQLPALSTLRQMEKPSEQFKPLRAF